MVVNAVLIQTGHEFPLGILRNADAIGQHQVELKRRILVRRVLQPDAHLQTLPCTYRDRLHRQHVVTAGHRRVIGCHTAAALQLNAKRHVVPLALRATHLSKHLRRQLSRLCSISSTSRCLQCHVHQSAACPVELRIRHRER